jgi:hypothetical protein
MSLFDLPQVASELVSANQGSANAHYRQITATRNVGLGSFGGGGNIQFRFETGGRTWFVPDKSYFRIRCKVTTIRTVGGPETPPLCRKDLAIAMGVAGNLFKTAEVQLNGKIIERVGERLAQIDALKQRICKSKGYLDSIGRYTNFWDHDWDARREQICIDGWENERDTKNPNPAGSIEMVNAGFSPAATISYNSAANPISGHGILELIGDDWDIGKPALRPGDLVLSPLGFEFEITAILNATDASVKPLSIPFNGVIPASTGWFVRKLNFARRNDAIGKNSFEIIWQPPMGFFDLSHAIPPGGSWTMEFDPENITQFRIAAVQSVDTALRVMSAEQANRLPGDFNFEVEQMYLYLYTIDGQRFDNGKYYLDIQHMRCQQESMNADSTGLVQKNFDVSGETNALTLMFQDGSAGTSTLHSRSLFKIRPGTITAGGGKSTRRGQ